MSRGIWQAPPERRNVAHWDPSEPPFPMYPPGAWWTQVARAAVVPGLTTEDETQKRRLP